MEEKLEIEKSRFQEVVVISTISSGKSTFINAILEKELLPTMNQACTSKILLILNNDEMQQFVAHFTYSDGKHEKVIANSKEVIERYHSDENITNVVLEGNIKSIYNTHKLLLLVDTPGINNSRRDDKNVTLEYLKKFNKGIIVYLINVNQIGTTDDKEILLQLKALTGKKRDVEFMFVVNKMDEINRTVENPKDVINNIYTYLDNVGFDKPNIYPICAAGSLIFNKVLNGELLSIDESIDFLKYYGLFKSTDWDLKGLSINAEENNEEVFTIINNEYSRYDIKAALDNTGITKVKNELIIKMLKGMTN